MDASSIAAHTSGYFRGYRRGQEVGGYSVGGRPGRGQGTEIAAVPATLNNDAQGDHRVWARKLSAGAWAAKYPIGGGSQASVGVSCSFPPQPATSGAIVR